MIESTEVKVFVDGRWVENQTNEGHGDEMASGMVDEELRRRNG